jgi:hypothetical protein
VSPVKYELSFYIADDDILHSHRCENLRSYIRMISWRFWVLISDDMFQSAMDTHQLL